MGRMNYLDFRKSGKKNKYKNEPIVIDGHKFPSKKEAGRYCQLRLLEKSGEITNLQMQIPFELQPHFRHNGKMIRAIIYIADFVYFDKNGRMHIEDTKGFKTDVYELKKKIMLFKGYEIEEI